MLCSPQKPVTDRLFSPFELDLLQEKETVSHVTWGRICTSMTSCCSSESSCIDTVVSPVVFSLPPIPAVDITLKDNDNVELVLLFLKMGHPGLFFFNIVFSVLMYNW